MRQQCNFIQFAEQWQKLDKNEELEISVVDEAHKAINHAVKKF